VDLGWFFWTDSGYSGPVKIIADRYQLLEVISSGGMATVWKARDTRLGRLVALKRPHPAPPGDESVVRLGREARAAAALNHPNLITVYDFGTDATGPYLVMELVDGPTLQDMVGRLDADEVVDLGSRLAAALAVIHDAGIVHRDVKPANVIMSERGPLLTDFGIATDPDATAEITQPGMVVATPSYAAPEVLAGQPPTPVSDVYSLGVVIDELIRRSDVTPDPGIDQAIAAAVAESPADRPDAAGLAEALRRAAPAAGVRRGSERTTMILATTPPPAAAAPAEDEADRTEPPTWLWVAGVLVLAAAALVLVGLAMGEDDQPADAAITPITMVADTTTTTATSTTSSTTTILSTTTTVTSADDHIVAARDQFEEELSRPPRSTFNPPEVADLMKKVDEGIEAALGGDFDKAEEKFEETDGRLEEKLAGQRLADARAALHQLADLVGVELDDDDDDDDD
jgi:eukaryotic-like serine/threonine-protein kinase